LGLIGSAVLTFLGYKQTDRQTDKPNLYKDGDKCFSVNSFKLIKVYKLKSIVLLDWKSLTKPT